MKYTTANTPTCPTVYQNKGAPIAKAWETAKENNDFLSLNDNIEQHAAKCFKLIYQHSYKTSGSRQANSAYSTPTAAMCDVGTSDEATSDNTPIENRRTYHGIAHVSRVALYTTAFYNLYRHYNPNINLDNPFSDFPGDNESALPTLSTNETVKLLQLAGLFHDSARENDGEDHWDRDSAEMLYHYLIEIGADSKIAVKFAEVIANKDLDIKSDSPNYYKLSVDDNGITWQEIGPVTTKPLLTKLLHDADCLDIIRARKQFDPTYLDCFDMHLAHEAQDDHSGYRQSLLFKFIADARRLINDQGDRYDDHDLKLKADYTKETCFQDTRRLIETGEFETTKALVTGTTPPEHTSFISDNNHPDFISESNLNAAALQGRVFFRGIDNLNSFTKKSVEKSQHPGSKREKESASACEIYKMCRRPGIPTRTSDIALRLSKDGNPNRSISSLIGRGTTTYTRVGFGMVGFPLARIIKHADVDCDSGRGSKKYHKDQTNPSNANNADTIQHQINVFIQKAEAGKLERYKSQDGRVSANGFYSEAICDKLYDTDCNCLIFTRETTGFSKKNDHSLLEAIYLQQLFKKHTGRELPIFEYSGMRGTFTKRQPSEDDIFDHWKTAVINAIDGITASVTHLLDASSEYRPNGLIAQEKFNQFLKNALSSHNTVSNIIFNHFFDCESLDAYYPDTLKNRITEVLDAKKQQVTNTMISILESLKTSDNLCQLLRDIIMAGFSIQSDDLINSLLNLSHNKPEIINNIKVLAKQTLSDPGSFVYVLGFNGNINDLFTFLIKFSKKSGDTKQLAETETQIITIISKATEKTLREEENSTNFNSAENVMENALYIIQSLHTSGYDIKESALLSKAIEDLTAGLIIKATKSAQKISCVANAANNISDLQQTIEKIKTLCGIIDKTQAITNAIERLITLLLSLPVRSTGPYSDQVKTLDLLQSTFDFATDKETKSKILDYVLSDLDYVLSDLVLSTINKMNAHGFQTIRRLWNTVLSQYDQMSTEQVAQCKQILLMYAEFNPVAVLTLFETNQNILTDELFTANLLETFYESKTIHRKPWYKYCETSQGDGRHLYPLTDIAQLATQHYTKQQQEKINSVIKQLWRNVLKTCTQPVIEYTDYMLGPQTTKGGKDEIYYLVNSIAEKLANNKDSQALIFPDFVFDEYISCLKEKLITLDHTTSKYIFTSLENIQFPDERCKKVCDLLKEYAPNQNYIISIMQSKLAIATQGKSVEAPCQTTSQRVDESKTLIAKKAKHYHVGTPSWMKSTKSFDAKHQVKPVDNSKPLTKKSQKTTAEIIDNVSYPTQSSVMKRRAPALFVTEKGGFSDIPQRRSRLRDNASIQNAMRTQPDSLAAKA